MGVSKPAPHRDFYTRSDGALKAPFTYFGGKSKIAAEVWKRLGDTPNYVEPFAGSLAVLLGRPHKPHIETINDFDGFVVNFWRSITYSPEDTAHYADWPVNELDLTARHLYLVERKHELKRKLETNPDHHDPKLAGYWCWGLCCWIGSGWCSGAGPWVREGDELVKRSRGVSRQLPRLGSAGAGVNRVMPKLSRASGGIMDFGTGTLVRREVISEWFAALSARLRNVRSACGDFERILSPTVTTKLGLTAVFLDPPYEGKSDGLYADEATDVAARTRGWAIANGDDPLLRIALCGYAEHDEMAAHGWTRREWKAQKGYQKVSDDGSHSGHGEVIWFSPHCLKPEENNQGQLFTRGEHE